MKRNLFSNYQTTKTLNDFEGISKPIKFITSF